MRGSIGRLSVVVAAALGTFACAPVVRPGLVASSTPLTNLTGTWVGGFTDSTGAMLQGGEATDTLMLTPDSSFIWASTAQGANSPYLGRHKWARLTTTNISWFGGSGYEYQVKDGKLSLTSVETDPNGGGKTYIMLWRASVSQAQPPVYLPLPPMRPPAQLSAQSGPAANFVGMWVGGLTDSSHVPFIGMTASDTLVFNTDSSYAWTRTTYGRVQRIMAHSTHPSYAKWRRITPTELVLLTEPGHTYKLAGDTLFLASVRNNVYLTFTRAQAGISAVQSKPPANTVAATPPPQFESALNLLQAQKFDTVEKLYATLQKDFEAGKVSEEQLLDAYTVFYQREDHYRDAFDGWIKAYPKSASAYLARGAYFRKLGEYRRGTKYAANTPPEAFEYMEKMFVAAREDLTTALHLNPKSYDATLQLLNISYNNDSAARKYLELGDAILPSNLHLRASYLLHLTPRWGGSYQRMDEFIDESRSQGVSKSLIDLFEAMKYNDQGAHAEELRNLDQARLAYRKALNLSLSGTPSFRKSYLIYAMQLCQEPEYQHEPYCQ